MINVLYLGMSSNILAPLFLFPNLITIYAICKKSNHSQIKNKSWREQTDDIRNILITGNDKDSWYYHNEYYANRKESNDITYLKEPSKITFDEDNKETKRWELRFSYDGLERKLIYFYDKNYLDTWPNEIVNVNRLMVIASPFMMSLVDNERHDFINMMKSHLSFPLEFYGSWNHLKYDSYGCLEKFELCIGNELKLDLRKGIIESVKQLPRINKFQLQDRRLRARLRLMRKETKEEKGHHDKMCKIIAPSILQRRKNKLKKYL